MTHGTRDARDPGAQPERTRFAWRRTTLAFGVVLVLEVRRLVVHGGSLAGYATAAVTVCTWLVFLVLAQRRIGELAAEQPQPRVAGQGLALAAAGCVAVAAVSAGLMML